MYLACSSVTCHDSKQSGQAASSGGRFNEHEREEGRNRMITVFDDLADLVLIEILSHLSSTDALWTFTCLNDRWTRLVAERGFFRQVNLSATYCGQFRQLLQILPLNNIETLVIDRTASSLQLSRCSRIRQHPILCLTTCRNTHSCHHPIGRIFPHRK